MMNVSFSAGPVCYSFFRPAVKILMKKLYDQKTSPTEHPPPRPAYLLMLSMYLLY